MKGKSQINKDSSARQACDLDSGVARKLSALLAVAFATQRRLPCHATAFSLVHAWG